MYSVDSTSIGSPHYISSLKYRENSSFMLNYSDLVNHLKIVNWLIQDPDDDELGNFVELGTFTQEFVNISLREVEATYSQLPKKI